MNHLVRSLPLLLSALAAWVLSGCSSGIESEVVDSAALGKYDLVFVSIDEPWIGTHSVVGLLQQELQRRGYAVRRGLPPEELRSRAMILKLDHAGAEEETGKGSIDELRHLDLRLLDATTDELLAAGHYHDEDLDPIEQKLMLRELTDQIFGPR